MNIARALGSSLLVVLSACGAPGPTPGVDAGPNDAAIAPTDTGTSGGDPIAVRVLDVDEMPIVGAVVAVDRPGGARMEATTGADGLAHFDVDWANGPFDLIAWASGFSVRANVRRDRALYESELTDGAATIILGSVTPEPTITVTGTITGITATTDNVYVYNTASASTWSGRTGMYTLEIPANAPFQLLLIEAAYTGGMGRDFTQTTPHTVLVPEHAGSATDLALDVDLTMNEVTPTTVAGSFVIPPVTTTNTFFDTAGLYVTVFNASPVRFGMGTPTLAMFATGARSVSYEMEYVLPAAATMPRSLYALIDGDRRSQAMREGVPVAGPQTLELLASPEVRELTPGAFPHVFETVVLLNADPIALPGVVFTAGEIERYRVSAPAGADHIVIPPLPTGAEAAGILADSIARQVYFCVLNDGAPADQYCERFSSGFRTPAEL
jgi:hypothetical protein